MIKLDKRIEKIASKYFIYLNKFKDSNIRKPLKVLLVLLTLIIISDYYLGRINIGPDHIAQYIVAKQVSLGNGLSILSLNLDDLATPISKTVSIFPPGFTYIVAPLFLLFDNIHLINVLVALFNLAAFSLLLIWVLKIITHHKMVVIEYAFLFFFLAIDGFLVLYTYSTDVTCINLFLLAAIFLIQYQRTKKMQHLIFACAIFPLMVYVRYAYLPALFVLPTFYLWRILFMKSKETKEFFATTLLVLAFSLPIGYHIYSLNMADPHVASATANYEDNFLFFENIKYASPFPFATFFDEFQILKALGFRSEFGYDRGYNYSFYIQIVFYIISLLILIPVFLFFKRNYRFYKKDSPLKVFSLYGLIFTLGVVLFLYLASIIVPGKSSHFIWSWAMIYRYYYVPGLFILLILWTYLYVSDNRIIKFFIHGLFAASILFAVVFKIYNYTYNYTFFAFERNSAILRPNEGLLNSYYLQKSVNPKAHSNAVFIYDETIQDKYFKLHSFLLVNNVVAAPICKFANQPLLTSSKIDVYLATFNDEDEEIFQLIKKNEARLYKQFSNGVSIYHFVLEKNI